MEIAKLQGDATNLRRDIDEARKDVREMRDRVIALEVKVDHLPGKGFIVAVVTSSLVIAGGFLAIIPRLQAVLAPPIVQSAPAPAAPPATPP
ncbi:hypothetical protein [Mesorhizobium sp. BR1-1-4]|uniref:hypothetical protein n=1 Tax=Mesorhizobium sp. BR1-1-4 TaxID=2876650 RepID=UPI001CCAB334|nr:hypothetical protein [Mesorhizobium sp. BR1-1-4]MBZ9926793.1 hypothetical protein [Mesorhizobium sp. BR1-1-4]